MKLRSVCAALLFGAIFVLSALCSAQGIDSDPNNPANWKIQKNWTGWVQRDIYDVNQSYYHDYAVINGPIAKGGYFLLGGNATGSKTYAVQLFAQCHLWVTWIGYGPAPQSVTIKVGPACHAEVDDAVGNNFNASGSGAGLNWEIEYTDNWTTPGPPVGFWETFDDNIPTGDVCTVTLAPGPSGGTYNFSTYASGGLYSGSGEVLCSCNMGASFYHSP